MDIEQSKNYITSQMQWLIDDSTFQVLDKDNGIWIARVTTTHNSERGDPEQSFFVLVRYTEHFVMEEAILPVLLDWCLKQVQ